MPTPTTIGSSKLYIGPKMLNLKEKLDLSDFASASWVEIDGATTLGSVGVTQNTGSVTTIKSAFERFFKTTKTGSMMDNTFVPIALDPGQIAFAAAQDSCENYAFKVEWGAGCTPTDTVTISVAAPGVVTWANHGFVAGQPIVFSSTGALPTGLTAGRIYYVIATGLTSGTFSVSATPGGTGIATTAAGSGTHTASAPPAGMTLLFAGLAMTNTWQGGEANATNLISLPIQVNSNIVRV